jgi:uncharacterized protein (DUF2062 family)
MLKEGMSLKKSSLCIAAGIVLGIFPVLGMTTLLCMVAAFVFRLNLPAIQMVNYLVYPLQLILIAPFYGIGRWLFTEQNRGLINENLISQFQTDFWGSMATLGDLTLYAILTWLIISPLFVLLIYSVSKSVIRNFAGSFIKHSDPGAN